jgi:putative Mg2+ transporter-C (MgtC) family protein
LIKLLGAGVILREGINIRGLNTAATLWCAAMVGTFAAGAGQLVASVLAGAFIVGTNLFLRPIVRLINKKPLSHDLMSGKYNARFTVKDTDDSDSYLRQAYRLFIAHGRHLRLGSHR